MRLFSVVAAAILFLGVRVSDGHQRNSAAEPAVITVDGSRQYQRIEGFGVNANPASWNDGELRPALDMLIDQTGMTIWRVIVEAHRVIEWVDFSDKQLRLPVRPATNRLRI